MRKNVPITAEVVDIHDSLFVDGAAKGAHVDITVDAVPALLMELLTKEEQHRYFRPGYRFRLINMWRSVLLECQDRPLALCDFTSIDANDLVATDRVYPTATQETYHVKYNPQQRWYWLPRQQSNEPFLFITYDSQAGSNARYCPHVSIENPSSPGDAPPRESVETRILVITKS